MKVLWTAEYVNIFNESVNKRITNLGDNQAIAFTDGAYSQKNRKGGYGIVFITQGNIQYYNKTFNYNKQSHKSILNLHNVGTECEAVKFAVKQAIEMNMEKITIYYDYEGICKWLTHEWDANKNYTEEYVKVMTLYSKKIEIGFVKVKSHIGIIYNELADKIAVNALLKP